MFKNTIKKFAAVGLVAVLCVPCCFVSAQMQEEPNGEKSYSKEDLPGLIEKDSREKNYFYLDAYKSRVRAEASGELQRELIECLEKENLEMVISLSVDELAKVLRADMSREDAFLVVALHRFFNEVEEVAESPAIFFLEGILNEVYGESYSK